MNIIKESRPMNSHKATRKKRLVTVADLPEHKITNLTTSKQQKDLFTLIG